MACRTRQPMSQSAAAAADERIEGQQDRGSGEHREADVVDPHPAEHVAEPAEVHDQDSLDEPVAHDHPQQVEDVAGRQRIQVDAAENRRQRDDDNRAVERRHEDGGGRVSQRNPPVAVADRAVLAPCRHQIRLRQSLEQRHGGRQLVELSGRETGRQCPGEPLRALRAPVAQNLLAVCRDGHDRAAAVTGIGPPLDEAARLQRAESRAHGLRADLLLPGQVTGGRGAAAVEPGERRALRHRQLALRLDLPQPPDQQSEADAQRAGDLADVRGSRHSAKATLISFGLIRVAPGPA